MAADVKTEIKIPDLWFDFYARLIPGAVFIATFRSWSVGILEMPDLSEAIVLLGAGYFAGLITQPASSRIVSLIEKMTELKRGEKGWLRELQYKLGRNSRDSLILSKMHGEVTMYVQLAVLTILFWVQNSLKFLPGVSYTDFKISFIWCLLVCAIFIASAFEVAGRRVKRGREIKYFLEQGYLSQKSKEA